MMSAVLVADRRGQVNDGGLVTNLSLAPRADLHYHEAPSQRHAIITFA